MIEIAPGIVFNPDTHEYFQVLPSGLRRVPSVTQVLEDDRFARVPRRIMAKAMNRGHDVHSACFLDDKGTLDKDSVREEIRPYMDAYWEWKAIEQPEIVEHEKGVYSKTLDVAGRFDLLHRLPFAKRPERLILTDIKTGKPEDKHIIQLAGYAILRFGSDWLKVGTAALYLKPNGKPKFIPYTITAQMAAGAEFKRAARRWWDKRGALE